MSRIKFKKFLGVAMTTAMVMSMAMPSMASSSAVNVQDPGANTTASQRNVGYDEDGAAAAANAQTVTNQVNAKITINNVPGDDHVFDAVQIFTGDISTRWGEGNQRVLANVKWGEGLKLDGTDHKGQANPVSFIRALMADTTVPNTVTARTNTQRDVALAEDMSAQDFAEYLGNLENDDAVLRKIAETLTLKDTNGNYLYLSGTVTKSSVGKGQAYDPKKYTDTGVEMFQYEIKELPAGYYVIKDQSDVQDKDLENLTRNILKLVGDSVVNTKSDTIRSYKKVGENTKYDHNDDIVIDDDNTSSSSTIGTYDDVDKTGGKFGDTYNDTADYEIGDTIPFEFIAPIIRPEEIAKFKDPYEYIFHDTMSKGLTLDEASFQVGIFPNNATDYVFSGTGANAKLILEDSRTATGNNKYTYSGIRTEADGSQIFSIKIEDMRKWVEDYGIEKNDVVVVRFTAKLNDQAVIGQPGNSQKMELEYSNNPNGEGTGKTPEDENIVFTYELDVTKVDGQDQKIKLDDAYFVFYRIFNGEKKYAVTKTVNGKSQFVEWQTPKSGTLLAPTQKDLDDWNQVWGQEENGQETQASKDAKAAFKKFFDDQFDLENGETVVLVSRADGSFEIQGLDDTRIYDENDKVVGRNPYYLHEIKAPKGYNLMDSDIRVEIEGETNNGQNSNLQLTKLERKFDITNRLIDPNNDQYKVGSPDQVQNQPGDIEEGTVDGTIANNRGTVLPSTGGMGTTLFYSIGGVLVLGAAILMVTRKRLTDLR